MANEGWNKSGGFGGGYLQRKFFPRTAMLSTGFALAVSVSSAQVLPALAQSRVEGYQYPPRVAIQTEPQDGWLYTASYTPPPVFDPVQGVAPAAQLTQYRVKTCSRFLPDTDRDEAWQYVVTRPKISTLVDDFNAGQVTTRWESVTDTGSTVSFTNQRVEIQPPSNQASPAVSYGSALARDAYDLASSSIYLELVQPSQGTPLDNAGTGLSLVLDRNNWTSYALGIAVYPNNTLFYRFVNGVYADSAAAIPYDPVAHRWLRIRHDGSQVQWDTSANGTDWTNRASWTPTFPVTALYAELYAGVEDTTASPTVGILDNVNTPPSFLAATSPPDTVRPKTKRALRQTDQPQDGWLYTAQPSGDVWDASKFQGQTWGRTAERKQRSVLYDFQKSAFDLLDARATLPAYEQLRHSFRTAQPVRRVAAEWLQDIAFVYTILPQGDVWVAAKFQNNESQRLRDRCKQPNGSADALAWLYPVLSPAFDPALFIHRLDERMVKKAKSDPRYATSQQGFGLLDARLVLPALAQLSDSFRPDGRALFLYAPSEDMGWLYPTLPVAFDPQYLIHVIDDQIARARRSAPQNDQPSQAWLYANLPAFAPAFFIHGQPSFRTDDREQLELACQAWVNDLSWLHDVLGLVDTPFVPGTVYQRPIAPIMSARRRKRRPRM